MEERNAQRKLRSASELSFKSFTSSSSTLALKESDIGSVSYPGEISYHKFVSSPQLSSPTAPIPVHRAPLSPMDPVQYRSDSRRSSTSSVSSYVGSELIRIPADSITITKEKVKNGGRGPVVSRELSKPSRGGSTQPSRGGSTQTSGRTTPVNSKPPKMMSEAAIRVSASLLSHNDRLNESPDSLGSVFNADYNVSPLRNKHPSQPQTETNGVKEDEVVSVVDAPFQSSEPLAAPYKHNTPESEESLTPRTESSQGPMTEIYRPPRVESFHEVTPISWSTTSAKPEKEKYMHHLNGGDNEVTDLLKQNALLEGKVEMLSVEAETAIKERAQCQSELGALKSKLKLLEDGQAGLVDASHQHELTKQQRLADDMHRQNSELNRQLTAKSTETNRLTDSLNTTQDLNNKLQSTVTTFGQQLKEKESDLSHVSSKLKLLESQLGSVSDDKQTSIDKISSLHDDVKSLTETKEWYQTQLHSAQETRNNLQDDLTKLQNLVSTQADALERVKVENSQVKHQLGDTQHKALAEKQMLIRHLEAIEADMLEREAGFQEMETEKGLSEFTWQQKMMQIEKERMSLSKLMTESSDLQRELQRANHDLQAKIAEIDVLETQQDELNKRLMVAQQTEQVTSRELEFNKERLVEAESTLEKVQKQDRERGSLLQSLKQEKASLQTSLDSALEEKKSFSKAVESLKSNTARVEQNFKQMKQELTARNIKVTDLEREKAELINQLENTPIETAQLQQGAVVPSAELEGLREEHQVLQDHLSALRHNVEDAEDRAERLSVEKRTLELQLTNMKTNAAELEHILQKSHSEKVNLETALRESLGKIEEHNRQKESDNHLQQVCNNQQIKMEQLQGAVTKAEASLKDRVTDHETSVNLLNSQLHEALAERDTAKTELRKHEEAVQSTSNTQQEHLYAQIQMLRTQLEAVSIQKSDLEKQISSYHSGVQSAVQEYQKRLAESSARLTETEQQLVIERAECQASIERHRAECDTNRKLSIDLEKEKGRLEALKEQHTKLKQHAADLETALAQRESTLVQLNAANQTSTRKHDQTDEEQRLKLRQLEEDLTNQTSVCDSLQQQLGSERQAQTELKETASSLQLELECVKQELDKKSLSLVSSQSELSTITEMVEKQSTNIAMLNKEYRTAKIELEQLRRSVSENAARNPIISDEMQALQWQVKQRTQEAKDAQSQLKLCEQRMQIETESIRTGLAETKKELDFVKLELEGVRKDKFSYQSRVAMLRSALKNLLSQCRILSTTLAQSQPSSPNLTIDEDKYEELLKETSAPGYKSKPLENLKSCLSGLHSEISNLQTHMDQHKNAIQTNNESWRAVETEVADLEKLIHASREATKARASHHATPADNVI